MSIMYGPIVVGLSLAYGYTVYRKKQVHETLTKTEAVSPSAVDEGLVEVEGTVAKPVGGTTVDTMRGVQNAVAAGWVIDEWVVEDTDDLPDKRAFWRSVGHGVSSVPFVVEGDDGTVIIDVGGDTKIVERGMLFDEEAVSDGASTSNAVHVNEYLFEAGDLDVVEEVRPTTNPSSDVASFISEFDNIDAVAYADEDADLLDEYRGYTEGRRRYSECTIQSGDSVYVRGQAVDNDDGSMRIVAADDLVVLSNMKERTVESLFDTAESGFYSYKIAVLGILLGLALTGVCLATRF